MSSQSNMSRPFANDAWKFKWPGSSPLQPFLPSPHSSNQTQTPTFSCSRACSGQQNTNRLRRRGGRLQLKSLTRTPRSKVISHWSGLFTCTDSYFLCALRLPGDGGLDLVWVSFCRAEACLWLSTVCFLYIHCPTALNRVCASLKRGSILLEGWAMDRSDRNHPDCPPAAGGQNRNGNIIIIFPFKSPPSKASAFFTVNNILHFFLWKTRNSCWLQLYLPYSQETHLKRSVVWDLLPSSGVTAHWDQLNTLLHVDFEPPEMFREWRNSTFQYAEGEWLNI